MGVRTITVTVTVNGCTATNILEVFISDDPEYCAACLISPNTDINSMNTNFASAPNLPENNMDREKLNAKNSDMEVQVYPNPFEDHLNIKLGEVSEQLIKYRISEPQGRVVQSGVFGANELQSIIEFHALPSRLYILTIDLGKKGLFHKRIIKY